MSDLISKRELYHKLGESYNKGYLSWGANEIIKDIIGECDSVENKGDLIRQAEDYENEIADLHNRLDIAEYDKERYKEEITILETENKEELTNEKAIAFLQDNGWLVEHDRIMTSGIENKGEWIAQDIHNCHTDFKCSKCGYIHSFMHLYGKPTADYTYCPNCGADMRGSK